MKAYEAYKDSGVQWIEMLPSHWKVKRIKHTTYVKGRIGWNGLRSDEFQEKSDSIVVTGTDFENGKINWETCYQVSQDRYDEDPFIQLRDNDLLITKDGTIGKVALVINPPKIATLNSGVFVTRPITSDYVTEYMYWLLVSEVFISFYNYNKSGSTIQHLYQNVFNEFKFPTPTIKEQIKIAEYLSKKIEKIDILITKKEKLIELLGEERIAIVNHAVTKGLNPDASMKDSRIEWLGEIPEHWEVKRIKYLGEIISGYAFKSDDFVHENTGCRVMKISNIQTMNLDWSDESFVPIEFYSRLSRFKIKKNDLVFALTRPIISTGIKASIVDTDENILLNQRNAVLKPRINLNVRWMYYLILQSRFIEHFQSLIDGTGQQPNISSEDIANINIPLPPLKEQEIIINEIESKTREIQRIVSKTEEEIELLKEYKMSLISEVVTGKVDVRNEILN